MVAFAPSSPDYEPIGGQLAGFVSHWFRASDDAYVFQTFSESIRLEFLERPPLQQPLLGAKTVGGGGP